MTPNPSASSAPSRRSFLASTAVAAAAVAGGMPLLAACGGGQDGSKDGTTSGKDAKKILPTYVAVERRHAGHPVEERFGGRVHPARSTSPTAEDVRPEEARHGGSDLKIMSPFWGTPPKPTTTRTTRR